VLLSRMGRLLNNIIVNGQVYVVQHKRAARNSKRTTRRLGKRFPKNFDFFLNRYFGDWQRGNSKDFQLSSPSNFVPTIDEHLWRDEKFADLFPSPLNCYGFTVGSLLHARVAYTDW
jgi:hypothetical protein